MKKKLMILIPIIAIIAFFCINWRAEVAQVWTTFAANVLVKYNLNVLGNTTLGDAATDSITMNGYFTKIRVGTGSTPGITLGADDVFIEGTCEIDGETQLDGILDANSTSDFAGNAVFNANVTLGDAATDILTLTGYVVTLRVGTGATPGITLGADDVFIEGTCEVDGELQADGIFDANSTSDFAGAAVFNDTVTLAKTIVISLTAGENLTKGQAVVLVPDDIEDLMNSYANQAAFQAVYVDSDASNKMVDEETTNFATGLKALKLVATNGNNTNDYVAKTISSKDMSALTVHYLIRSTATSGDWEFRIGTGNLNTDYYKKAIVVSGANVYEHVSYAVSTMTGAGASEDDTAITRVWFFCVDDTGGSTLIVDRIWYTSGSGDYVTMKTDGDNWDKLPPIGVATASITDGDAGLIAISGILDGFTGLVPGAKYYADDATAGNIIECKAESTVDAVVGIAISTTELLILCNSSTD